MPTAITHTIVAVACGKTFFASRLPRRFWLLAVICSMLPDLDIALMAYGVQYGDLWGHRGMTHSLLFAVALGVFVTCVFFRKWAPLFSKRWWSLCAFFTFITASHGVLDAFTNGGLGVAFFSPFDTTRYFMPWTPIVVSPIGVSNFIKYGGGQTLISEAVWIWLPVIWVCVVVVLIRTLLRPRKDTESK